MWELGTAGATRIARIAARQSGRSNTPENDPKGRQSKLAASPLSRVRQAGPSDPQSRGRQLGGR